MGLAAVVVMVGLAAVVGMDSMELVLEGHLELVATETVELCLDGLVSGAGRRSTWRPTWRPTGLAANRVPSPA